MLVWFGCWSPHDTVRALTPNSRTDSERNGSNRAGRKSSFATISLLISATISPAATDTPRFTLAANPEFLSFLSSRTRGKRSSTIRQLSSVLASSTTISSYDRPVLFAESSSDERHRARYGFPFQFGTIILKARDSRSISSWLSAKRLCKCLKGGVSLSGRFLLHASRLG